eukprot:g1109.t1
MEEKLIVFRSGCEDEGDPTACYSLGEWYAVVKKDYAKAASLYADSCNRGQHANACFSLGLLYLKGLGGLRKSKKTTVGLWKKACALKHDRACHMSAEMLAAGRGGVQRDLAAARVMREAACARGDPESCHALGVSRLLGKSDSRKRDPKGAIRAFREACDRGFGPSCHNIAVMYRKGDGVERSDVLFQQYAKLAEQFRRA